jgi:hypothetical protein
VACFEDKPQNSSKGTQQNHRIGVAAIHPVAKGNSISGVTEPVPGYCDKIEEILR